MEHACEAVPRLLAACDELCLMDGALRLKGTRFGIYAPALMFLDGDWSLEDVCEDIEWMSVSSAETIERLCKSHRNDVFAYVRWCWVKRLGDQHKDVAQFLPDAMKLFVDSGDVDTLAQALAAMDVPSSKTPNGRALLVEGMAFKFNAPSGDRFHDWWVCMRPNDMGWFHSADTALWMMGKALHAAHRRAAQPDSISTTTATQRPGTN